MAKGKRRSRWTSDMQKVPIFHSMLLSTLASVTVLKADLLEISNNEYRILSTTLSWSLRGMTNGEVPIQFGLAHNDYSVTEIDECLEGEAVMTRGDKITEEQVDRLVRMVGVISGEGTSPVYDNGKMKTTRLNWAIADGLKVAFWARNMSGSTLTTGGALVIVGHAIIKWT